MKKSTLFATLLAALFCWQTTNVMADELTVFDGTGTSAYFPVYGNYSDYFQHVQIIYSESELESMLGAQISSMTFYLKSSAAGAWTDATFQISLGVTDDANFGDNGYQLGFKSVETTEVYSGALDGTQSTMVIEFASPFTYTGGNLFFELKSLTKSSTWKEATFYGTSYGYSGPIYSVEGHNSDSYEGIGNTNNQGRFVPKTTFTFTAGSSSVCKKPTGLTKGEVTAKTAAFTWTAGGDETQWQVVAAVAGQEPVWDGVEPVNEATATLSGLTPATAYVVYVRSYCAEDSQSGVVSLPFETECEPITIDAEHPWKENFNDITVGELPKCWDVVDANTTNKITISVFDGDMWLELTDNALRFNGKSSNDYGYALLPPFANDLNTLQIVFSHKAEDASSSGKIELGYYAEGEFKSLKAYDQSTTMKKEDAYPLTSVPAGALLAFGYKSNSSYDYAAVVDDIEVSLIPTCPEPTAIIISEVSADGAKVAWTSDASAFALQYRADEVNGWTDAEDVVNPFELKNLSEQTKYWVRVKAICGVDFESEWSEPVDFTTPCAAKTIGYSEAFGETLDACWDNNDKNGMYAWEPYTEDLENYMLRYATSNNVFAYAVLKTPVIALPAEEDAMLQFDWQNTGVTGITLKVSVDGAEAVDLSEELNAELNEASAITKQISLSEFAGQTVQFIFRAEGSANSQYAYIDNFQILGKICIVPKALGATPTLDGAIVTWEAGLDEEAWNLEYKAVAAEEWTGLAQSLIEPKYTITGLDKATEYSVRVRAICDVDETSEWTPINFTTLDDEPTAISNTNANATATKRIVNGQLIIERGGELFNAQGVNIR